jgi:hypothetical protein
MGMVRSVIFRILSASLEIAVLLGGVREWETIMLEGVTGYDECQTSNGQQQGGDIPADGVVRFRRPPWKYAG